MKVKSLKVSAALILMISVSPLLILSLLPLPASAQQIGMVKGGDLTITTAFDETYGKNGTIVTTRGKDGLVFKIEKKNSKGETIEYTKILYQGPKGIKRTIYTSYYAAPNSGLVSRKVIEIDEFNKEVSSETKYMDPKSGDVIKGTKTETDADGNKKNYRWDRNKQDWVLATFAQPAGEPARTAVAATAQSGYQVKTETDSGVLTGTVTAPDGGKITVKVTDDLAASDTFTGTVEAQPSKRNETERARSQAELNGAVIEMEQQQTSLSERHFTRTIPSKVDRQARELIVWVNKKKVATIELPISSTPRPSSSDFRLPMGGQRGRELELDGPFDGRFAPTDYVNLGGTALQEIAESPRKKIVRDTSDTLGATTLECKEHGVVTKGEFRNVSISLSAPNTNLLKGQTTTLHVLVKGLDGIKENVPLDLENLSPEIVSMSGGNAQQIAIRPSEVQAGAYATDRTLTGVEPGAFSIIGTVKWSDYKETAKRTETGERPENGAPPNGPINVDNPKEGSNKILAITNEDLKKKAEAGRDEAIYRKSKANAALDKATDETGKAIAKRRIDALDRLKKAYQDLIDKAKGAKTDDERKAIEKDIAALDDKCGARKRLNDKFRLGNQKIDELLEEMIQLDMDGALNDAAYRRLAAKLLGNDAIGDGAEKRIDETAAELKKLFECEGAKK